MTYEQTLHYLYNKLPLFSNIGLKAYKADLKNTLALCKFLGDPQNKIKTIHIAGTNGKGSTSHMLAALFQQQGYRTGLYTSPHLKDFRERIKINGVMVEKSFVIDFVEKMNKPTIEINPSFFELTFVMALEYFMQQNVDVAIIETGLGGRLDSTNVITPEISVITNIGYDHMDILGDTIEKIAVEKAGIIKKNVPVVIGETLPATKPIFKKTAGELNAPIFFAEEEMQVVSVTQNKETLAVDVLDVKEKISKRFLLDLPGLYQQKNLLTVLTVIEHLSNKFLFEEKNILAALEKVKQLTGLHGRWEVVHQDPMVVLDVAHNIDGITQLVKQLRNILYKKLHIVFGIVKDKEIEKVLAILPVNAKYFFTKAQIPRALEEVELMERAKTYHLHGRAFADVNTALKAAIAASLTEDLIIVCGSVFVVGEVNLPIEKE